jgi:hypothetical protein
MIVDPYFMRDVALANEGDRATVKEYLGNIFEGVPCLVAYSPVAVVAFVCEAACTVVVAVALDTDTQIV